MVRVLQHHTSRGGLATVIELRAAVTEGRHGGEPGVPAGPTLPGALPLDRQLIGN